MPGDDGGVLSFFVNNKGVPNDPSLQEHNKGFGFPSWLDSH
jgi:hypothetical protein